MTRTRRVEGRAVHEWFEQRGLAISAPKGRPTVLIADEVFVADLVVRRLWHTPLKVTSTPAFAQGRVTVALQAEGELCMRFDDREVQLIEAGGAWAYSHRDFLDASCPRPTARIEVISAHHPVDTPMQLPSADDGPIWRALASTINAILDSESPTNTATTAPLRRAIESLCVALIADRPGASEAELIAGSAANTFAAAMALVSERAADAQFSVADLAASLGVSRQYLARVFSRRGLTPRTALRLRRLDLAEGFEAAGLPTSEIAVRSGFRSHRGLLRALRERDVESLEA